MRSTPTVTSSVSNLPTDKIPSRDVSGPGTVEIQGVKSWLVKQALKGMAGGIRGGASTFIRLADDWLDAAATKALRNNSGRIADVIEDVAEIPDIASHQVRSQVYNGPRDSSGTERPTSLRTQSRASCGSFSENSRTGVLHVGSADC